MTSKDVLIDLVSDGAGGAITVWNTHEARIRSQRLNAEGNRLWNLEGIDVVTGTGPNWESDGDKGAIISWDSRAQRVNGNGNILWASSGVVISSSGGQEPQLNSDRLRGAFIIYKSRGDIYAQRVNDLVLLVSPNGGEYWAGGSPNEIKWLTRPGFSVKDASILFSTDSGISYSNLIEENTANDVSYTWLVPTSNYASVRIKLQVKDTTNNILAQDASDADFTRLNSTKYIQSYIP